MDLAASYSGWRGMASSFQAPPIPLKALVAPVSFGNVNQE